LEDLRRSLSSTQMPSSAFMGSTSRSEKPREKRYEEANADISDGEEQQALLWSWQ